MKMRLLAGLIAMAAFCGAVLPGHAAQRANPAAVYCLHKGGKRLTVQTPVGSRADCLLPNGKRVDEWVLFRSDHTRRK